MTYREIPLSGGNVNTVVRAGDTVRRQLSVASPLVHQLLRHLEAKGFQGSARFLGIDAQGREILSFIEGDTGIPPYVWQSDPPLIAVAQLLRGYHDAVADFKLEDQTGWAYRYPDVTRHEVICHNDFALYNLVYRDQLPVAVIDFDLAGPGPRLRDIAYAAYWTTPLSFHGGEIKGYSDADLLAGSRRLKLFCASYGITPDGALLDMIAEVLTHMGDETQMRRMLGAPATARLKARGHLAHWQREAAGFAARQPRIEENITRRSASA